MKRSLFFSAANSMLDICGGRDKALIEDFAKCVLPDKDVFVKTIQKRHRQWIGPNGIPFVAYSADIGTSAIILERTAEFLRYGGGHPGLRGVQQAVCLISSSGRS